MNRRSQFRPVPEVVERQVEIIRDRLALLAHAPLRQADKLRVPQELFCLIADAVGETLVEADPPEPTRESWISALRFLAGAAVLPRQTGSLAIALSELDRGVIDERLKRTGNQQGGKDSSEVLFWKAAANEALEEIARAVGGITKAIDEVEVALGIPEGTVKDLRRQVLNTAPSEWRNRPLRLSFRSTEQGQRIDPLVAFSIAYNEVVRLRDGSSGERAI